MYATLPDTNYSPPNAHLASLNNSIYVAVIVRSTVCRIAPASIELVCIVRCRLCK